MKNYYRLIKNIYKIKYNKWVNYKKFYFKFIINKSCQHFTKLNYRENKYLLYDIHFLDLKNGNNILFDFNYKKIKFVLKIYKKKINDFCFIRNIFDETVLFYSYYKKTKKILKSVNNPNYFCNLLDSRNNNFLCAFNRDTDSEDYYKETKLTFKLINNHRNFCLKKNYNHTNLIYFFNLRLLKLFLLKIKYYKLNHKDKLFILKHINNKEIIDFIFDNILKFNVNL